MANKTTPSNFLSTYFPTFMGLGLSITSAAAPGVAKISSHLRANLGSSSDLSGSSFLAGLSRNRGGSPSPSSGSLSQPPLVFEGTTRTGISTTASPMLSSFTRLTDTYIRRDGIQNDWAAYETDPRLSCANYLAAWTAVRGGFTLNITAKPGTGTRQVKEAQKIADECLKRCDFIRRDGTANRARMMELLMPGRVEGDLFVERVVNIQTDDVVAINFLPAASMERLSDNADQFPDPNFAFAQFDVAGRVQIGSFAEWQCGHYRYRRIGGDRYGQPIFKQARQVLHSTRLLEDSAAIKRITNSARIETYSVGDPNNGANDDKEIEDFKKANGFDGEHAKDAVNVYQQSRRRIGNAFVKYGVLPSDGSVGEVEDIRLSQGLLGLALNAPLQLLGYGVGEMSRDEMSEIKDTFYSLLEYDEEFIHEVILDLIEFQLTLKGIRKDSLNISLSKVAKTTDTFVDTLNAIKLGLEMTLGMGKSAVPHPIFTPTMIADMLRPHINFPGVKEWVTELDTQRDAHHIDPDTVHANTQLALTGGGGSDDDDDEGDKKPKPGLVGSGNGSSNSKTTSPTTGYGATTHSSHKSGGEGYKKV